MWRSWELGDKVFWDVTEFSDGGRVFYEGRVTQIDEDHLIVEADGMHLWVDDDTADQFHK